MKKYASAILLFCGSYFVASPATAATYTPCSLAEKELESSYSYLAPAEVKMLKSCLSATSICVLMESGKVIRGRTSQDLSKEPTGAMFALLQLDGDVCLLGQFSGGSAAAWLFRGWRTSATKPTRIEGFDKTRLNSDSVFPSGLVELMKSAYEKKELRP